MPHHTGNTPMRGKFATEDWWAVWLGLILVGLGLPTAFGVDLLGWTVTANVWVEPGKALAPVSRAYADLHGTISLGLTFLFLLGLLTLGAYLQGFHLKRFIAA